MIIDGYAPARVSDSHIELSEVCPTESEAGDLLKAMKLHQPHRGEHNVVPVMVMVTIVAQER